jgi:hypothetical protein
MSRRGAILRATWRKILEVGILHSFRPILIICHVLLDFHNFPFPWIAPCTIGSAVLVSYVYSMSYQFACMLIGSSNNTVFGDGLNCYNFFLCITYSQFCLFTLKSIHYPRNLFSDIRIFIYSSERSDFIFTEQRGRVE